MYTVLELDLDDYKSKNRCMAPGYEFHKGTPTSANRWREALLLVPHFVLWPKPLCGRLAGFRSDSRVFLLHEGKLVAGVYLCAANDLARSDWGQLHYAFIHHDRQGHGLYGVIFQEAVQIAREWGFKD